MNAYWTVGNTGILKPWEHSEELQSLEEVCKGFKTPSNSYYTKILAPKPPWHFPNSLCCFMPPGFYICWSLCPECPSPIHGVLGNVTQPLGSGLSLRKQGYAYTLLLHSFEGLENQETEAGTDISATEQIQQSLIRNRGLNWQHHPNLHPDRSSQKKSDLRPKRKGREERIGHSHHLQTPHLDKIHMCILKKKQQPYVIRKRSSSRIFRERNDLWTFSTK